MGLSAADADIVRAFRRNAVHVRRELATLEAQQATAAEGRKAVQVVNGYIQEDGWVERYRRVSTPVRRAAMESDKASLTRTLAALERGIESGPGSDITSAGADITTALARARTAAAEMQAELDTTVTLGGRKIARGEMFRAWMDAAVFYDSTDKQRPYDEMVAAHGKAIESMSADLTEAYAALVLAVDEAAALALDEPLILPPPERTPPPPPDPREKGRWKRVLASLFKRNSIED